jgi:hypothetical protein
VANDPEATVMSHQLTLDHYESAHPIGLTVDPALEHRNRLTCAFRVLLAIPHLIMVGGPIAIAISLFAGPGAGTEPDWGAGGGLLGVAALMAAMISWFAIVFTGHMPKGLWKLNAFYLRWRVRSSAYVAMLRDEFPPLGEGSYAVRLDLPPYRAARDRVSVGFRLLLALPHLFIVWLLGIAWLVATIVAWFAILFSGRYPRPLYEFAVGVLRWSTSAESYLLLLQDEFPPFSLS